MKLPFRFQALSPLLIVLVVACASVPPEGPMVGPMESDQIGLRGGSLDDMLAQQAGVRVEGRGERARIHVSGADYPTQPLFVIDGVAIGHDFSTVWQMVTVSQLQTIRVIRANSTEAVRWGARGGNGVVEFVTRRGG